MALSIPKQLIWKLRMNPSLRAGINLNFQIPCNQEALILVGFFFAYIFVLVQAAIEEIETGG